MCLRPKHQHPALSKVNMCPSPPRCAGSGAVLSSGLRPFYNDMQEVGGTGSITAVQVKGPESDWEGMSNKWGAAWEISQAPKYPLDIHLTNDQGQEVRCARLQTYLA